ncbi:unnamed protein product [Paramecium octaurelia]|uniref:Uncharacterized protein n=1 Tax=Paramecium octaurelia TaxID=43137 RepID=A0A8S1WRP2_PAROT|nr:unnamed protein product [Paramecium octaurelia]
MLHYCLSTRYYIVKKKSQVNCLICYSQRRAVALQQAIQPILPFDALFIIIILVFILVISIYSLFSKNNKFDVFQY